MPLFETTPISKAVVANTVLEKWGLELGDCVKESQNHTFQATEKGTGTLFSVRVTPDPSKIHAERIRLELDLLSFLKAESKLSVCGAVPTKDGAALVEVDDLIVVVFEYARGSLVNFLDWKWLRDVAFIRAWGAWMGEFHKASMAYSKARPMESSRFRNYDELHEGVLKEAVISPLDLAAASDPTKYGVLHGDMNISNFFWDERTKELCVFDWDQSMRGFYMYDLAQILFFPYSLVRAGSPVPAADGTYPSVPEADEDFFTEHTVAGYESVVGVGAVDRAELQRFLRLRRDFYELFCRKAITELAPGSFMYGFCSRTVEWIDAVKAKESL